MISMDCSRRRQRRPSPKICWIAVKHAMLLHSPVNDSLTVFHDLNTRNQPQREPLRTMMRLQFVLLSCVGILFGGLTLADEAPPTVPNQEQTPNLPLDELRTFADVFERIKNDYVEEAQDQTLIVSAIRGMLAGLDPHSAYLDQDEYRDLKVGTTGEFGGLGIEVGMEDGFVKVVSPIDDTPAQRAGVQSGDLIIRIDDKPVKGMSLNDAVKLMRGDPGTKTIAKYVHGPGCQAPSHTTDRWRSDQSDRIQKPHHRCEV